MWWTGTKVLPPRTWRTANTSSSSPSPCSTDPAWALRCCIEIAHIIDYETGLVSASDAWTRALAQSPCAVSDYATVDPQQDFAESMVAFPLA